MSLRVLDPGLHSLVVDYGRPHHRSLGVPVGGAADWVSMALGNALVGNPPETAAIEITLAGPKLQAECDLACVVYGAPFEITCGRRRIAADTTFNLTTGDVLRVGGTRRRTRAYVCIHGGIQSPAVLGSRSGLEPLQKGDVISCATGHLPGRSIPPHWLDCGTSLRCLAGAQVDWFAGSSWSKSEYSVTTASNRMGIRLEGMPLPWPGRELVSEPVCPGSVQVTRDGQCIILGVDGQTIGGYPKIAQVISADLPRVGQLRPGDKVRFEHVTLQDAEHCYDEQQRMVKEWLMRLQVSRA